MIQSNQYQDAAILDLWDAFAGRTERISIRDAAGRTATSTIRQYPPGIPEIIPGMLYTPSLISSLESAHKVGSDIIGIDFTTGGFVDVLQNTEIVRNYGNTEIRTYLSKDLSPATIVEIADFFRIRFASAPYFHFAFYEKNPLKPLPPGLDFEAWKKTFSLRTQTQRDIAQSQLLAASVERSSRSIEDLPSGIHVWTEKDLCRRLIADRLTDPGYVTLVRDPKTTDLLGLLHSRMGSLERLFQSEEWQNPFIFSHYKDETSLDCPSRFFGKMKDHFGLEPSNKVMTISAQILTPEVQGSNTFYNMMRSMAEKISPVHADLPLLCEIPDEGTAHVINTAFTDRLIFGALRNEHPLVFCQKTSRALFPFMAGRSHWQHTLRHAVRAKRQFEKQSYVASSTDNPNLEVRENGAMGLAVFATQTITKGSRIAVFEGETYRADDALSLPEIMRDHAIQTGLERYVFGYRGLAHCLCHSCEPNCGIRNLTEIFAAQDIEKGEQLTWDYRCSENSTWSLDVCLCGSVQCTGQVGNFDSLTPEKKNDYLKRNMVSEWLANV